LNSDKWFPVTPHGLSSGCGWRIRPPDTEGNYIILNKQPWTQVKGGPPAWVLGEMSAVSYLINLTYWELYLRGMNLDR